jgi:TonB-linked SusC/RagA family outer membrane protein
LFAQRGTVSGRVTAAGTNQPLADSRVMVVNTSLAASTGADGRYTLRGVPVGPVEIRVLRVGFQEQKKPVTVTSATPATLDFVMSEAVVQLAEIVTTATGEQRRVEIGNAVTTLGDISKKVETAPVTNLADLMVAKAPGVTVLPGAMTGSTPVVHIRGTNSLSLSNDPIYVIDGVRMNTDNHSAGFTGTRFSYLNDLDPNQIEDIEIVKRPSAATLYGTDAANGVIVITTKKGVTGSTRWTWYGEQGVVQDNNPYAGTYAMWGHDPAKPTTIKRCVLSTIGQNQCALDSTTSVNILRDAETTPFHNGGRNEVGGNASGGSSAVRFFLSGDVQNEVGPIHMPEFALRDLDTSGTKIRSEWRNPEAFQSENFRANLSAAMTPKLDLNANAGWANINQRLPQVDNNIYSFFYSAYNNPGFRFKSTVPGMKYDPIGSLGENRNGYGVYSPAQIFQRLSQEGTQRFIGGADAQWRPFTWMQNQAAVGLDLADRNDFRLCRLGECPNTTLRLGTVSDQQSNDRNFSAKVISTSSWSARSWAQLKTTFGADYNNLESDFVFSSGQQLPPGGQNVDDAAIRDAGSQLQTVNKTLGLYAQEELAVRDRLWLTLAARTDQNSAFGTNFQRVIYPKASVSWIASDEDFFPKFDFLNQLRLRLAYGASGVQPRPTQALRTFGSATANVSVDSPGSAAGSDTPGLLADRLGNADLKPERSGELEAGFEMRLFGNRANLDFTYYDKKTRDALIDQPIAASSGASRLTITRNLGSVQNTGVEATLTTTLLDKRNFGWDLTIGGSHNTNKIVSMGLDASGNPNPTIGTGTNRDSLGLPVNGVFSRPFTFEDKDGNGIITPDEVTVASGFVYAGYSAPRDIVTIQNGVDLFRRKLHLQALLDYKGGFILNNSTVSFYCQQFLTCYDETHLDAPLERQARVVALRYEKPNTNWGYLENGQFWKLREVSATLTLPDRLAHGVRARDVSLLFAARNLHTWTAYTGVDPESNYGTGDIQTDFSTTAPRRYFILRLNLHY